MKGGDYLIRHKKTMLFLLSTLTISTTVMADSPNEVYKTTAVHSINLENTMEDYKPPDSVFNATHSYIIDTVIGDTGKDETKKFLPETPNRSFQSAESNSDSAQSKVAKSYLIANNIYNRKSALVYNKKIVDSSLLDSDEIELTPNKYNSYQYEYLKQILYKLDCEEGNSYSKEEASTQLDYYYQIANDEVVLLENSNLASSSNLSKLKKSISSVYKTYLKSLAEIEDSMEDAEVQRGNIILAYCKKLKKSFDKYDIDLTCTDSENMLKSDFLMTLYKATYEVIPSKPICFQQKSRRKDNSSDSTNLKYWLFNPVTKLKGYWGTKQKHFMNEKSEYHKMNVSLDADFSAGDFFVYYSPDVYELYLKAMLDKGLIFKSDLDSTDRGKWFLDDYKKFNEDNPPDWYGDLKSISSKKETSLGYSALVEEDAISYYDPQYFNEESLTMMDALKYIESFLRTTEKEMTKKEASIISYKYGLDYLADLTKEEQETVSFLIAKGILNFEDASTLINLYGTITHEQAYLLLYRIANKEARFDFSKIQLTDSENFWQEKGYGSKEFSLCDTEQDNLFEVGSVTQVEEEEKVGGNSIKSVFTDFLEKIMTTASADTKDTQNYKVVMYFDKKNTYKYNTHSISEIRKNLSLESDIVRIKDTTRISNGASINVYQVVFKVSSTSRSSALAYINKNLTMSVSASSKKTFNGVTLIKETAKGSPVENTLISADTLKEVFPEITILEDKVLINEDTKTQAIILPDYGYALVGNQVKKSNALLMQNTANGVYYNLDLIVGLLPNTGVVQLKQTTITKSKSKNGLDKKVPVSSDLSDSDSAYYRVGKLNKNIKLDKDCDYKNGQKIFYYKVDSFTKGLNTLYRTFSVKDKNDKRQKVTVVLDLVYAVPTGAQFENGAWYTKLASKNKKGTVTVNEVLGVMYKRPDNNTSLQAWWDSNYGMSNALANFIYGTKGLEYIKCGYLAPSLTILSPPSVGDKQLQNMFQSNGFSLVSYGNVSYDKFVNGSTGYFWRYYYGNNYFKSYKNGKGLTSLAGLHRQYQKIDLTEDGHGKQGSYYYYLDSNDTLYKNVDIDSRLEAQYSSSKKSISKINIKSVTKSYEYPPNNSIIKYKGKKWIYVKEKDGYMYLLPAFKNNIFLNTVSYGQVISNGFVSNSDASDTNKLYPWPSSAGNIVEIYQQPSFWKTIMKKVYADYFDLNYLPKVKTGYKWFGTSSALYKNKVIPSGSYTYGGGSVYTNKGKVKRKEELKEITNFKLPVYTFPLIRLPIGTYYVYKDDSNQYCLGKGYVEASLQFNGMYYSSLSDSTLNALIANHLKLVKVGTLATGHQIYIGDTVWTKNGDYYVSNPIKSSKLAKAAKKYDKSSVSFKSEVSKLFSGFTVTCDSKEYPITNYFSNYDVANLHTTSKQKLGLVYRDSANGISVWKNGVRKSTKTSAAYTVVKMKINENLLVRPLDTKGTTFTVMNTIASGIFGTPNELPFFSESLSYNDTKRVSLGVQASRYFPSKLFLEARDRFQLLFQKAFMGDLKSWFLMVIMILASYLSVMSWFAYLVLTKGYMRFVFEVFAHPTRGSTHIGFDVMKYVTFGVFTLDDEPTFARVSLVIFVSLLILYISYRLI